MLYRCFGSKAMDVSLKIYTGKKDFGRFLLVLFILITLAAFIYLSFLPKEKPAENISEDTAPLADQNRPPPFTEHEQIIQRGQTLSDILPKFGFSPADIHTLRSQVKPVYDLAKIKAGQKLRIFTSENGDIHSLEYDIDEDKYLLVHKEGDIFEAALSKFPIETRLVMIWGSITDNLISAVSAQNERDLLALMLAEVFAWDIDFYTDLRKGDTFKILFEKKYLEGEFIGYGNIMAAEFSNRSKTFQAFRYTYPDSDDSDYFTYTGKSLRKEFLRSPFKFGTRITSGFSHSRLHPVRKVYRPHYGVDYAAPVGTPVYATADGTVTFAGWNGASGRMVRIRHNNNYETLYLHLSRCLVKKGNKVKGGDIIGKVGNSGESTGPHLDYRVRYVGRYINPLSHRFKPVKPLREEFLADFQEQADALRLSLDTPVILFVSLGNPLRSVSGYANFGSSEAVDQTADGSSR